MNLQREKSGYDRAVDCEAQCSPDCVRRIDPQQEMWGSAPKEPEFICCIPCGVMLLGFDAAHPTAEGGAPPAEGH